MSSFLPTVLAFAAMVVGVSYAPVPTWYKILVVLSGIIMMFFSAAMLSQNHEESQK